MSSPSELLIEALERFGESEPIDAVLVYINEAGDIVWKSTSIHRSRTIGMLELAKSCIVHDVRVGK